MIAAIRPRGFGLRSVQLDSAQRVVAGPFAAAVCPGFAGVEFGGVCLNV